MSTRTGRPEWGPDQIALQSGAEVPIYRWPERNREIRRIVSWQQYKQMEADRGLRLDYRTSDWHEGRAIYGMFQIDPRRSWPFEDLPPGRRDLAATSYVIIDVRPVGSRWHHEMWWRDQPMMTKLVGRKVHGASPVSREDLDLWYIFLFGEVGLEPTQVLTQPRSNTFVPWVRTLGDTYVTREWEGGEPPSWATFLSWGGNPSIQVPVYIHEVIYWWVGGFLKQPHLEPGERQIRQKSHMLDATQPLGGGRQDLYLLNNRRLELEIRYRLDANNSVQWQAYVGPTPTERVPDPPGRASRWLSEPIDAIREIEMVMTPEQFEHWFSAHDNTPGELLLPGMHIFEALKIQSPLLWNTPKFLEYAYGVSALPWQKGKQP